VQKFNNAVISFMKLPLKKCNILYLGAISVSINIFLLLLLQNAFRDEPKFNKNYQSLSATHNKSYNVKINHYNNAYVARNGTKADNVVLPPTHHVWLLQRRQVKVKKDIAVPNRHAMRTYATAEVQLHALLTLVPNVAGWSA